jgi:hypothetical protein
LTISKDEIIHKTPRKGACKMGSFNVACSVSNISIDVGDPIIFIPLLPHNVYDKDKIHRVGTQNLLIYSNCYFNPFCLPIKGIYGDYGYVEDVVKDANTDAIENFFGISIEEFLDFVIGGNESPFLINDKLNSHNIRFDEKYLLDLGFQKTEDGNFAFEDFPFQVRLTRDGNRSSDYDFDIVSQEGNVVSQKGYSNTKDHLNEQFLKLTGCYLNVPKEKQKLMAIISSFSGMYVHGDIYAHMAKDRDGRYRSEHVADSYLTEEIAKNLGFEKVSEDVQIVVDPHHENLWRKKGFPWDIKIGNFGSAIIHQRHKEYYIFDKSDGKKIKRLWEKMTKTDPEKTFSDPIDIEHVTDDEFKIIKMDFKNFVDTEIGYSNDAKEERFNIFSVKTFRDIWQNITGELLDISQYEIIPKHELEFEKIRKTIIEFDNRVPEIVTLKYGPIERQKSDYEQRNILYRSIAEMKEEDFKPEPFVAHPEGEEYLYVIDKLKFDDPLRDSLSISSEFIQHYRDWKFINELYRDAIKEGTIKKNFVEYWSFFVKMYSCNRFFFPAMNGEQFGNPEASKILLEASLKVINKKIEEREEE